MSVAVALADKIDTLTAFWAIEKKPTGSSDPYALRRAAVGLVRQVLELGHRFKLRRALIRSWRELALSLAERKEIEFTFWVGDEAKNRFFERVDVGYRVLDVFVGRVKAYKLIARYDRDRYLERNNIKDRSVLETSFADITFQNRNAQDDRTSIFTESIPYFTKVEFLESILPFFHDRLKVHLRDKGHRFDAIDAVLARADGSLEDDLVLIVMKLEALEAFLKTEDGANLAAGFKRAANILKAEEKKSARSDGAAVSEELFQQVEEKSLFAHLAYAEKEAKKHVESEEFDTAMALLSTLRAPIDAFFDKVTVNADDPALRANRLALLQRFIAATATVADLSKLEG